MPNACENTKSPSLRHKRRTDGVVVCVCVWGGGREPRYFGIVAAVLGDGSPPPPCQHLCPSLTKQRERERGKGKLEGDR